MYDLDQVRRGILRGLENPAYFGRELNQLYHRRLNRREFNPRGVDVFGEDWDNLLILDACRYDEFAALHDLPGVLESRISRGSHTVEFLRGNVSGRDLLDVVYVTASPQFAYEGIDGRFHAVENVWDDGGWDESAGTVLPETMAARARDAAETYPDKRLVVHFVQPHYPFLGTGDLAGGSLKDPGGMDIWGDLMHGSVDVSPSTVREAYRRNLEAVLPSVGELLDTLGGRSVVTADHGNLFGERAAPVPVREWGHPPGLYVEHLVRVPWLVHGADRRTVRSEAPAESAAPGSASDESTADAATDTEDRLRHLGYVE